MRLFARKAPIAAVVSQPEQAEPGVPALSPARILAQSLTSPETRGEWTRESKGYAGYWAVYYRNEARNISVTRTSSLYSSPLSTPFTLNKAEERFVREALEQFDRRVVDEREKAALARLLAPASVDRSAEGGETGSEADGLHRVATRARWRASARQTPTPKILNRSNPNEPG